MKKVWIAMLLFSQVFFTVTPAGVLASVLTTIIGGQVVVTPWLSGWNKRVKITIDHNDVGSVLSNFPVLIYLSNSSGCNKDDVTFVFDEVESNSKKIAVTTSDGTTQCYVEVEKWNATGKKAWLWVKVTSISNTSDTELYLYYDNSHADNTGYVGDTGSTPAEKVWDANYKFVGHMRDNPDTSHIKDSTSNNNDGTKRGAGEPAVTTSGKIDDAQDFDGSNDYVEVSDSVSLSFSNYVTVEAWVKPAWATYPDWGMVYIDWYDGTNMAVHFALYSGKVSFYISSNGTNYDNLDGSTALDLNQWSYIVATFDSGTFNVYLNGQKDATEKTSSTVTSIFNSSFAKTIGIKNNPAHEKPFNGTIDEVCISNVAKSAAWIKASYENGRDDLLDFVL